MEQSADAAQLRGREMATEISELFQSSEVDITSSPTLLGLSDVLNGTADWLSGKNGDLRELLGFNPKPNADSAKEQKLAECLKKLAAFQRSAVEELQEDDAPQPKDLNSTLFSARCVQPCLEKSNKPLPEVGDTVCKLLRPKVAEVNSVKNVKRREVKEVQHKSWSNSTRSPVRPIQGTGVKSDKSTRPTNKSPNCASNSRQYVIHSNPLASGRRLSAAGSKRKDSIVTMQKSPTKCKRMSNSPALKSKPAEKKRADVGGQDGNVPVVRSYLEKTPTSKSKVPRLTDRQKEILKRVMMNSPMSAKKMTQREKNNALLSSVDLSAAGRRARRLSQVLRNEHEVTHQNHQYAEELHQLQRQYAIMEDEADRAQSAGMLLRQVCANQAEELKAYKEAFPTLCKDLTELRDEYQKREKELKLEIRAKLSLQAEVSKLRERVDSLSTDIKQTRTLNTVLAERVQQHEKTQCTSCRLYINQKPVKKAISPMAVKKAGHPLETPPRPRSELKFGKRNSPRLSVVPMTEVENDVHLENKKTILMEQREDTYNCQKEFVQHDSALHVRSDNVPQKPSSTDCPPVDALKSRINSLLLTASQAVES